MRRTSRRWPRAWLAPLAALALGGCFPALYSGPSDDYDLAYAKSQFKTKGRMGIPAEQLTLEQLYAVHRYGLGKVHPSTSMNGEFARRGAGAVPFLRAKLERQTSWGQVGSILEAFKAMQDAGTFDVRSDPSLVSLIQRRARSYDKDPYGTLPNLADELETGTRIPSPVQPYYRKPRLGGVVREGRGDDYDVKFAQNYCRRCTYRRWTAGLDRRPIEQLYALQRYSAENFFDRYNIDHIAARRGASAIPFYKAKLAEGGSDIMVWNILSTLEAMRDLGTYDVAGDAELMRLAEAAAARADPHPGPLSNVVERLKTGARQQRPVVRLMG